MKKIIFLVTLLSAFTLVSCENEEVVTAESLQIEGSISELEVGKTYTLSAITTPTERADEITWTSSDESVATIDSDGVVTGISIGEVTITATSGTLSDTYSLTIVHNLEIAAETLTGGLAVTGTWYTNGVYEADLKVYLSEDRFYRYLGDEGTRLSELRYVESEDGSMYSEYLNYDNTVGRVNYSYLVFKDNWYNPFSEYKKDKDDLWLNEDGTCSYMMADGDRFNNELFSAFTGYSGRLSDMEFVLNNDSTVSTITIEARNGDNTYTLELEVTDPYSIGAIVVPFETTEESDKLQSFFDEVNELNYTATVIDNNDEYIIEATEDKFYYSYPTGEEYVYLDTEGGLDLTEVSYEGEVVTLTGIASSLDPYSTVADYIPTLDVKAELFELVDENTYVLRSDYNLYNFARYTLIDTWFFDYYGHIVDDTLKIVLDEDGLGATILYDYLDYENETVVTKSIMTVISKVGTTVDRFINANHNSSIPYVAPTKWSEFYPYGYQLALSIMNLDMDEVPCIDFNEYGVTELAWATDGMYYWENQLQFGTTDEGATNMLSAYNDYADYLVEEGWAYDENSERYSSSESNLTIGVSYYDSSTSIHCISIYIYK